MQSESMWSLGMVQKGRHLQTVPSIKISHYEIKCVNMIIQNKENLLESWSVAGPQKLATNITFEVPKKMSSRTLQVRGNSPKRRQEYLDISKLKHKLTFYSLHYTLAITKATMNGVQTWLDEAWLMAEKHSHRSLIRCKKIVRIYAETVKQEEGIVYKPSLQSDRNLSLKCWMLPKVVETGAKNAKSTLGRELLCAWSIRTQGHSAKRGTEENPLENTNANRFSSYIIGGTSQK